MKDSAISVPPSIWASVNSWFTSTVFFVLLNLMIATIVFTSNLTNNNQKHHQEEEQKQNSHNDRNQPQTARSPSILHRLKSFNFYPNISQQESSPDTHHHHDPLEEAATQYVFNQPLHYQCFDIYPTISDQNTTAGDQFYAFNQTHEPIDTETRVVWAEHEQPTETVMTHFDYDPTHEQNHNEEEEHGDEFQSSDEVYKSERRARLQNEIRWGTPTETAGEDEEMGE